MAKKPEVLVAVDFTDTDAALLDAASDFARRIGAAVRAVHVTLPPPALPASTVSPEVQGALKAWAARLNAHREAVAARLDVCTKGLASRGVEAHATLVEGRPREALVAAASAPEVVAVVLGPHAARDSAGGRLLERLIGSTGSYVVRHAPCPVLVVEKGMRLVSTPPLWVVGVDLSEHSARVFKAAAGLAARAGARVLAAYVYAPVGPVENGGEAWQDVLRRFAQQEAEGELRAWLSSIGAAEAAPNTESAVIVGDPAGALEALAHERGAELLLVGTHGRGAAGRFVLGSVAEKCLRVSRVPMLVLPNGVEA
ncbi:MAG: universal stress protein [Myxococcales bacterium]|nr:universal stress protein [Myxococcales bacterium]